MLETLSLIQTTSNQKQSKLKKYNIKIVYQGERGGWGKYEEGRKGGGGEKKRRN